MEILKPEIDAKIKHEFFISVQDGQMTPGYAMTHVPMTHFL